MLANLCELMFGGSLSGNPEALNLGCFPPSLDATWDHIYPIQLSLLHVGIPGSASLPAVSLGLVLISALV